MRPFMEKSFALKHLDACRYVRCESCGLVVAETLYDMPHAQWQQLNRECHAAYQHTDALAVDPNWLPRLHAQAELLTSLKNFGVIDSPAVDFGAGDGKLSDFAGDWLMKFDEFMSRPDENYLTELAPGTFNFVITCSVFEHLLGAADVEKIFDLLTDDGTCALHTLVCEEVPRDPNWFYLQPVHATFWTNAAMKKIFARYGFKACAYHVEARLWLMFRDAEKFSRLKSCVERKSDTATNYGFDNVAGYTNCSAAFKAAGTWSFAADFVDYWKVKPYRS